MKKLLFLILFLFSLAASAQVESVIPNPQNPPRLVNDFTDEKAKFLTAYQRDALENKLVAYDDSTSNQIAIVIVDGLDGYSRDDYAIALGNKWGVGGQKTFSNGVVILISTGKKDGKRTSFIATGYGLEGALPDVTVKNIIDNELVPNLKAGNNFRALDETADAIIQAAEGRYKAPEGYANRGKKGIGFFEILLILFILLIVMSIMSGKGGSGGMMSRRGYRDWTGPVWFPGSGGGGGWSGGGGGGFGGFGGGSFGGGGAGGDW